MEAMQEYEMQLKEALTELQKRVIQRMSENDAAVEDIAAIVGKRIATVKAEIGQSEKKTKRLKKIFRFGRR